MNFLILLVSLILLSASCGIIVSSAKNVALKFKIPTYLIGLFILSIGTDFPELILSIQASFNSLNGNDSSSLILGNAIGSCITQGSLVMGLIGLSFYLQMAKKRALVHGSFLVLSSLTLLVLSLNYKLTMVDGLLLLLMYATYLVTSLYLQDPTPLDETPPKSISIPAALALIILGFFLMHYSANLVLDSILNIANEYNFNKAAVSVLGLGIGTSLPEIFLSFQAIRKKESDLFIGNIIGSNIFDTLVIPGISAIIYPVGVTQKILIWYLPPLIFLSLMLLFFLLHKKGIQRSEGIILLVFFSLFFAMNFFIV